MKKFLYTATIGIVLWSCSGGGDDPKPLPPAENKVPTTPTLVSPTNGKLCIDNSVGFQWNTATDPDGDVITYQIQVAKDNQFTQIAHSLNESSTIKIISLEKAMAYYWRVKATDSKSLSGSYSAVFNFYTEGTGETNHIPFSPELVKPVLNSIVQTTTATLEWNANDVDVADALTFDVFFGTVNPPTTKIGNNQTAKTLNTPNLVSSTNYYWKVLVKDGKGGETIGQVWNFKTD
jgi:hypothetical protein